MSVVGLDVGTNSLVAAIINDKGNIVFRSERDAFYRIIPKSTVNREAIKRTLEKSGANFIVDDNGNFNVIGEEAIQMALDRGESSMRPMSGGVLSPKDKDNFHMLKLLIKSLVGEGSGENLVYSVPAAPIDSEFDIDYHTTMLNNYFNELGFNSSPINEGFAIGLSELLDDNLTGMTISAGAGMMNVCILAQGDPVVTFSTTKSGDYIDNTVAKALDLPPSLIQLEKESGVNLNKPTSKILEAVNVYYTSVIRYTVHNIQETLKNKKNIPIFREPISVVLSGGLANAKGYDKLFREELLKATLPFKIKNVRIASDPNKAVANGALLAAQL